MDVQADLDRLRRDIDLLKVDFDRFLAGALPIPPQERRDRLMGELRRLQEAVGRSLADRYLLGSLEARFNALNELYNRRLRERERGPAASLEAARPDPSAGVVVGESVDAESVAVLYAALNAGGGRGVRTDLDSFARFLRQKAAKIRKMTGCREVRFRIDGTGGKMKLKARPERVTEKE